MHKPAFLLSGCPMDFCFVHGSCFFFLRCSGAAVADVEFDPCLPNSPCCLCVCISLSIRVSSSSFFYHCTTPDSFLLYSLHRLRSRHPRSCVSSPKKKKTANIVHAQHTGAPAVSNEIVLSLVAPSASLALSQEPRQHSVSSGIPSNEPLHIHKRCFGPQKLGITSFAFCLPLSVSCVSLR